MPSAPKHSEGPFWPDGARLAVSLSMHFEAGSQPERGAESPFQAVCATLNAWPRPLRRSRP